MEAGSTLSKVQYTFRPLDQCGRCFREGCGRKTKALWEIKSLDPFTRILVLVTFSRWRCESVISVVKYASFWGVELNTHNICGRIKTAAELF